MKFKPKCFVTENTNKIEGNSSDNLSCPLRNKQREREREVYGSNVFFAGDGVEELEVDDVELLKLLDQFDDVSIG